MQEHPPPEFLALVRQSLKYADPSSELKEDTDLAAQGLDSFAAIGLLLSLEESYGMKFRDEDLTTEIFRSPLVLWRALANASAGGSIE